MNFEELARSLEVEGLEETPSQVHGYLCGRIAGGERLAAEQLAKALIENLDSEEEVVENALPVLGELYHTIITDFESNELSLQLFLPADDAELNTRVVALSEWCQFFVSGLGSTALVSQSQLSEDLLGVIRDLTAIAQVSYEGDATEEDETDLVELVEYVRMASILIFSEMNVRPAEPPVSPTLH